LKKNDFPTRKTIGESRRVHVLFQQIDRKRCNVVTGLQSRSTRLYCDFLPIVAAALFDICS
jgi:hypothetical protein